MHSLQAYRKKIENALEEIILPETPETLYEPVRYMLRLGGKRIRPILTLMGCEMFDGKLKDALRPALAMEMFHNFTLVHDDLMDHAEVRRGKPSVHRKWNSSTAILSGDVMLVLAYEMFEDLDSLVYSKAIRLFNDTAKKVCEGQQLDMVYESEKEVTIAEYVEMIGLKTAALLAGSLGLGALIAGASERDRELIYNFGFQMGTAFQLQDDLLDAYGNEKSFGKAIGGDIVSNKKTYLTIKAFELAEGEDYEELMFLFSNDLLSPSDKIKRVMDVYEELNIRKHTERARDSYFDSAIELLGQVEADKEGKELLMELANELVDRES